MHPFRYVFIAMLLMACGKEEDGGRQPQTTENFLFEDGFETENNALNELFPPDGSRWSTVQQVDPPDAENEVFICDTLFSEGGNSLGFRSFRSDSLLSKIDIEKGGLNMGIGDEVILSADFYIKGNASVENLFLLDLECCSCWDPSVGDNVGAENQCPGIRLMMSGDDGYLSIERGKISGATLHQTSVSFPRDQWVSVRWEMTMSDGEAGRNRLLINGVEAINQDAMNMPNAQIFTELFADQGIAFVLQEPVAYERVQIGATANPTAGDVELFVDNFVLSVKR